MFYEQSQQTKQYATIVTEPICPQIKEWPDRRQKKPKTKHTKVQQGSQTSPNVGKVHNRNNQHFADGLTATNQVTTDDQYFQNSPTNQSVSIIANQDIYLFLRLFFNDFDLM